MIGLGIKIGVVAFVAVVTFALLVFFLLSFIGMYRISSKMRKKERSGKVTKMPRKEK